MSCIVKKSWHCAVRVSQRKQLQERTLKDCKKRQTAKKIAHAFFRAPSSFLCVAHGMHFLLWWLGKAYFFKLGLPCMVLVPCIRIACLSFLHISLSPCGFGTVFWWKNPAISAKKLNDLAKTMPEKIAIYTFSSLKMVETGDF